MKSLNMIFAFLLVLFGSSNVFSQTCPKPNSKEITKYSDGNKAEYFLRGYSPEICLCLISFRFGPILDQSKDEEITIGNVDDRNGAFSKTNNYLSEIIQTKSRCPNENEFLTILKPIFFEELAASRRRWEISQKLNAEAEENKRLQIEAAKNARNTEMQKFCKGAPKVNQEIIEKISIVGRIDPQSVRLNRVSATEDGYCIATFYTSIGIAKTLVGFNANGVIVSHEQIVFPK